MALFENVHKLTVATCNLGDSSFPRYLSGQPANERIPKVRPSHNEAHKSGNARRRRQPFAYFVVVLAATGDDAPDIVAAATTFAQSSRRSSPSILQTSGSTCDSCSFTPYVWSVVRCPGGSCLALGLMPYSCSFCTSTLISFWSVWRSGHFLHLPRGENRRETRWRCLLFGNQAVGVPVSWSCLHRMQSVNQSGHSVCHITLPFFLTEAPSTPGGRRSLGKFPSCRKAGQVPWVPRRLDRRGRNPARFQNPGRASIRFCSSPGLAWQHH